MEHSNFASSLGDVTCCMQLIVLHDSNGAIELASMGFIRFDPGILV